MGIELDRSGFAPGPLGREQDRPRARERIDDDIAALRTIADCVRDQPDWLDGRMRCKVGIPIAAKRVCAGISST